MILGINEFFNKHYIKKDKQYVEEIIGLPKFNGSICLEEGFIETDGDILGGSYPSKDGKFYGYYSIEDFSKVLKIKTIAAKYREQIDDAIYSIYTYKNLVYEVFDKNYFGNRTTLTKEELDKIKEHNSFLFTFYLEGELVFKNPWCKECPTKEYPYRLYICGNDDTSYSKFFDTKEHLYEFFNNIKNTPVPFEVFREQMVFTN